LDQNSEDQHKSAFISGHTNSEDQHKSAFISGPKKNTNQKVCYFTFDMHDQQKWQKRRYP
jgi:hypothetical protein